MGSAASGGAGTRPMAQGGISLWHHPALTTKFLDSVEFKVWIEGLDLLAKDAPVAGKGVAVSFTGSVTYVNIPQGKDNYGVFYVHPSTLDRYSAGGGADDFDRKFNIHMEAYVGGALMDAIDKNKETDPQLVSAAESHSQSCLPAGPMSLSGERFGSLSGDQAARSCPVASSLAQETQPVNLFF